MLISACRSRGTKVAKRGWTGRQLRGEQLVFGERELVQAEDLSALFRMAEDQPQDRAIGRVGDRQSDNLDFGALEGADHFEELADPVLQEHRELRDGRPIAAVQGLEIDFAGTTLAKTHGDPRWFLGPRRIFSAPFIPTQV